MRFNRRTFLSGASAVAGSMVASRSAFARASRAEFNLPAGDARAKPVPVDDTRMKRLVQRGLDAVPRNEVRFADVRLSNTRGRGYRLGAGWSDSESLAASVRVLVGGYWGFASSPIWSEEEITTLTRDASAIAQANARGAPREVELVPIARVEDGYWETPVKYDPFDIWLDEIEDYAESLKIFIERIPGIRNGDAVELDQTQYSGISYSFEEHVHAYGDTEGNSYIQRLRSSGGGVAIAYQLERQLYKGVVDILTRHGLGWELFRDQPLRDEIRKVVEDLRFDALLPIKPIDVGRYDTVFDAQSVAGFIDGMIGNATLLTRAMGFNANDVGTSYVTDPLSMVGKLPIGNSRLNVSANRNQVGGLHTVRWDGECIAPQNVQLVTGGMLTAFTTTRESASWLKPNDGSRGQGGYAFSRSAMEVPETIHGNLVMAPGPTNDTFSSLVESLDRGIAARGMGVDMDFQCLNGYGAGGRVYEVRNGKRIALLANAAMLLRTPEFWKSVNAIGGASSVRRYFGTHAVPAIAKGIAVVDISRKA